MTFLTAAPAGVILKLRGPFADKSAREDIKVMNRTLLGRIRAWTKRRLGNESGQSTTEYILILAVVVMIAMKFKGSIGTKIETATSNIGLSIDEITKNPDR